jgi:hypothetical protein
LWGLANCEYLALRRQFEQSREFQLLMLAAIRSDMHNTAGRMFNQTYKPSDFMPGAKSSIEDRARELMDQGYAPAAAVAIASSKQSREQNLKILTGALEAAERKSKKPGGKRSVLKTRTG